MTDLITKTEYKAYRGISSANDDGRIDAIIPAVSNLVKTYCGRSFIDYYATNKVEYFTLKWTQSAIFLTEIPIEEVVSVEELDAGSQYTYIALDDSTEYVVDELMDAIYRMENNERKCFPVGINAVKVTYKGGFTSTPADLKLAVMDLVTYYYKDQYLPEKNHSSFTIRNSPEDAGFPEHIKRVLDLYRDV